MIHKNDLKMSPCTRKFCWFPQIGKWAAKKGPQNSVGFHETESWITQISEFFSEIVIIRNKQNENSACHGLDHPAIITSDTAAEKEIHDAKTL